jgi:hypothetical protein
LERLSRLSKLAPDSRSAAVRLLLLSSSSGRVVLTRIVYRRRFYLRATRRWRRYWRRSVRGSQACDDQFRRVRATRSTRSDWRPLWRWCFDSRLWGSRRSTQHSGQRNGDGGLCDDDCDGTAGGRREASSRQPDGAPVPVDHLHASVLSLVVRGKCLFFHFPLFRTKLTLSRLQELRLQDYQANRKAPSATPAFGSAFGASSTPAFGASQPSTGGGLFGQTSSTPAFGASNTTSTFGQPAAGGGLFGSSGISTFGQPATSQPAAGGGLFGAATSQPAQTGGLFGATPTSTPFGQPAAAAPTSTFGGFGATAPKPATTGFSFGGGATTTPATGGGLFGAASQPAQPASNPFGQPAQPASGGLFGQPAQPAGGAAPSFSFGSFLSPLPPLSLFPTDQASSNRSTSGRETLSLRLDSYLCTGFWRWCRCYRSEAGVQLRWGAGGWRDGRRIVRRRTDECGARFVLFSFLHSHFETNPLLLQPSELLPLPPLAEDCSVNPLNPPAERTPSVREGCSVLSPPPRLVLDSSALLSRRLEEDCSGAAPLSLSKARRSSDRQLPAVDLVGRSSVVSSNNSSSSSNSNSRKPTLPPTTPTPTARTPFSPLPALPPFALSRRRRSLPSTLPSVVRPLAVRRPRSPAFEASAPARPPRRLTVLLSDSTRVSVTPSPPRPRLPLVLPVELEDLLSSS